MRTTTKRINPCQDRNVTTSQTQPADQNPDPTGREPIGGPRYEFVTDYAWLHSHGMEEAGLPELEIRELPHFLLGPAIDLLDGVCDYMRDTGKTVRAGQTMLTHDGIGIRFLQSPPIPGEEDHYACVRLRVVDLQEAGGCDGPTPTGSGH